MSGTVNFIGVVEKVEGDLSTILIYPQYAQGLDGLDDVQAALHNLLVARGG